MEKRIHGKKAFWATSFFLFPFTLFLLAGCIPKKPPTTKPIALEKQPAKLEEAMKLLDHRADWAELPPLNVPRYDAEKFIKGMTIVIDPGHGGTDGGNSSTRPAAYKAGPRGEKEAFMNLRVSLLLERLLKDAGVNVIMTRHGDDSLSLGQRAEIANNAKKLDGTIGADLFVSIHHNAGGGPKSNFPSVWYHGSVDDNEPDTDVARYIALELGRYTRTQVAVTSPIFSSQLMYASGFGVLRQVKMPGVLCECSFMSSPPEEDRLRDATYNLREAYGIYMGLCEWAYCGRPTQSLPKVAKAADGTWQLTTTLDEGLPQWWGNDRNRIPTSTVQVVLDEAVLPVKFEPLSRALTVALPASIAEGKHTAVIHHANFLKNSNWPQRYELSADGSGGITVSALPARRPSSHPAVRAVEHNR